MKKWITAVVSVLGLALVLALTVLVLRQNGLLTKPAPPAAPKKTGESGEPATAATEEDLSSDEKRAGALGVENDALTAYLKWKEIKKNGTAILLPGASFRIPYWEPTVDKEAHYADVHYKDYLITKKRSDIRMEADAGYAYGAQFDRNGNITNEYSYVVVEFEVTCETDWSFFDSPSYFSPITYHSYQYTYDGATYWGYHFSGELYTWNPQTANPEHPCRRNYESNHAHWVEGGVTYSAAFVFVMEDKYLYLPEEELILLRVGEGPGQSWDPVRKENYNNPIPIFNAEGKKVATYTANDPVRDEGYFPHRELP